MVRRLHLWLLVTGFINLKIKGKKLTMPPAYMVYQSKYHKNILFIGLYEGIGVMSYKGGKWHYLGRIEGIDEMVPFLTEDDDGNLWHTAYNKYIVRVAISHPAELKYDSREEFVQLPYSATPNTETKLINLNGQIKLTTDKVGFYNADTKGLNRIRHWELSLPQEIRGLLFSTWIHFTIYGSNRLKNLIHRALKEPFSIPKAFLFD